MFGVLKRLFGGGRDLPALGMAELSRRLGVSPADLGRVPVQYTAFEIPKRSGGVRTILAPCPELKSMQRRILRRLLGRLKTHPAAIGFQRGLSIVDNAQPHAGQDVVIRLDLKDFFPSISAQRINAYFLAIGWDAPCAAQLTRLCTHQGALPQGAPTSPRLSNLVNHRLDARLSVLADRLGLSYTRWADDLTFSGASVDGDRPTIVVHAVKEILADEGYRLHVRRKLHIARRHQRQMVCGLVVNESVDLPRLTRRWLRAVEHRIAAGRPATLTPQQLQGWRALRQMIPGHKGNAPAR